MLDAWRPALLVTTMPHTQGGCIWWDLLTMSGYLTWKTDLARVKNTITFPLHPKKCLPTLSIFSLSFLLLLFFLFGHFFSEWRMWFVGYQDSFHQGNIFPQRARVFPLVHCWIGLVRQDCQSELVKTLNFKYPTGKEGTLQILVVGLNSQLTKALAVIKLMH